MTDIADRLEAVRRRIDAAARTAGRDPGSVGLVAVTKTFGPEAIRAAARAGQRRFGENQLQEALDKRAQVSEQGLEWHFLGRVQSNKTRELARAFDWVHSIDRLKVARRLAEQRPAELGPISVCLQVNISGEASKAGVALDALPELADGVSRLEGLRLRGLMTVPAPARDPAAQREPFRRLREAKTELEARGHALDTLSMGMTADLEAAIEQGATLVRVGTAIFGSRST